MVRGKAQAAHEFAEHFCGVIGTALHEKTKLVAANGVREVAVFLGMTGSARPSADEGLEHAGLHANAATSWKS
jgi:hypothetical protein